MSLDDIPKNFWNKGWMVTNIKEGQVKLCESEDPNIDLNPDLNSLECTAFSSASSTSRRNSLKEISVEKYKIVKFFIKDLLTCEKRENDFVCRGIPISLVFICGTVVSFLEKGSNYWIEVDDGSSSIQCFISKESMDLLQTSFNNLSSQLSSPISKVDKTDSSSDIVEKAIAMTIKSYKSLRHYVPSANNIQLGNIVKVIGRLSEHNGFKNIFISKIIREEPETSCYYLHLQELNEMYERLYNS